MNKEYIERSVIRKMISDMDWYHIGPNGLMIGAKSEEEAVYRASDVISAIENAPTADVAPVVHATWSLESDEEMPDFMFKLMICSACGEKANHTYNYCPFCGARMDGDKPND